MENINIFDMIVLTLVVLLGLKGLLRGFIKEFFALFGIIGGIFIASRLSLQVGEFVDNIISFDNNNTMVLIGFIVALAIFWILAYIVGSILSKVLSLSGLGIFDRFLGFVFGMGKIFLLFSTVAYLISQVEIINDNLSDKLSNSIAFPILKVTGSYIIKLDTTKLEKDITKQVDNVVKTTEDTIKDISPDNIKQKMDNIKKELKSIKEE